MRLRYTLAALLAATALAAIPSAALAANGDNFGFADINTGLPGDPEAPAFYGADPDTKAIWAGTCDLTSASTENGGVGAANGGEAPPAVRPHCIDVGESSLNTPGEDFPWPPGKEPAWRLEPALGAGSHPDATATFFFNYQTDGFDAEGSVKNIIAKLPPGVVGNPEALPKCSALAAQAVPPACGAESQGGITSLGFATNAFGTFAPTDFLTHPVYAIEARDTVTAEFTIANIAGLFNVPITARGRTNSDYGVDTLALLIPDFVNLGGQAFTFWGVPWAAEHDKFRVDGRDVEDFGGPTGYNAKTVDEIGARPALRRPYDPSWGPIQPFFTNPTECSGKRLPVTIEMDSWQDPVFEGGPLLSTTTLTDVLEGCDKLDFDPTITLRPDVKVSDSPSGLDVELAIPQNNDPPQEALGNPELAFDPDDETGAPAFWKTDAGLATAHLKDTVVKLPAGTSFNPAAANGLRGCTTDQIGMTATSPKVTFDNEPHRCPDTSKIGTLEIVSPLLPDPLSGAVYAAPQHDNPFPGSLTAIYMVSQDEERGLSIKLAGKVDLDEKTGQISTSFVDNPQLPFDTFRLKFKTGARAPLNTPATCGQYKTAVDLTPWSFPHSGPIANIQDPFEIAKMPNGLPCVTEPEDRSFSPGFDAGSTGSQAGADTSFVLNVTRRDGEQEVSGIDLDMPEGLVATLANTPYCPDSTLAEIEGPRSGAEESKASLCPVASEIGEVHTLAGAGPLPLPTDGRLYLAGPHEGAPLSVAAVVPAIAGGTPSDPAFDLGNVVVRSAAHVDPATAQVKVRSAPLPYIVGGVPLRVRRVSVQIAKPGFMRNPTDCDPMGIDASLKGAGDPLSAGDESSHDASSPFQVGGCAKLGFKPRLGLRLTGGVRRGSYQGLRAVLRARPGDANIGRAAVTMPRSAFLAQEHLQNICTRVQWAADQCPKSSIYGRAAATSPLLDYPLRGNVYLRSSDNLLPDLVADLRGPAHQPIRIELVGRTDSVKGALRNTFDAAPDAPVDKFVLQLAGGNKGLIVLSQNICTGQRRATSNLRAQNGRRNLTRPLAYNPRCKKARRVAKRKRAKHRRAAKQKAANKRRARR